MNGVNDGYDSDDAPSSERGEISHHRRMSQAYHSGGSNRRESSAKRRGPRVPIAPSGSMGKIGDGPSIDSSLSFRGRHGSDLVMLEDTVRKFRERKPSTFNQVMNRIQVIEDAVDMNRFSLKFQDAETEARYQAFLLEFREDNMRIGTYSFFSFFIVVQALYEWGQQPTSMSSGLPTQINVWWFAGLLAVSCLLVSFRTLLPYVHRLYYIGTFGFFLYIIVITNRDAMNLKPDLISRFLRSTSKEGNSMSIEEIITTFNEAIDEENFEKMANLARVLAWWTLASSSCFLLVAGVMILDAVAMSNFVTSVFCFLFVTAGCLVTFQLSSGPTIVLVMVTLSVHMWTIRYTETRMRHEFVITQKRLDKLQQEEEKIQRRNEALEKKLKLSEEQLKMIEAAEDEIVGDALSELGAWKIDVDHEVAFDKKVAAGAFGIVYLGKLRSTGRNVAVKQLLSDQVTKENMDRFFSEILLHSKLHHPHLVEMIGASWEPPNLCLVLSYCEGGDLKGLLESKWEQLRWSSHKLKFMKEISQAVAYLHSQHILHRDLKTANVLVDVGMKMRVSDFGESRKLKAGDENLTMVGTNFYIAPEVFRGDSDYDYKADVFGLGMIMLAMTVKAGSLRDFFVDNFGMKVKINANHASVKFNEGWRPKLLEHNGRLTGKLDLSDDPKLGKALSEFISTLVSPNSSERPNMNEVVKCLDNLDRWICISPPKWALKFDERIVIGASCCHPDRGTGSVVSFDGFERVHVLYSSGTDLYRRYSEEGWISKMSIGDKVTNPAALAQQEAERQKKQRRDSRSSKFSPKVGIDTRSRKPEAFAYGGGAGSMPQFTEMSINRMSSTASTTEGDTMRRASISKSREGKKINEEDNVRKKKLLQQKNLMSMKGPGNTFGEDNIDEVSPIGGSRDLNGNILSKTTPITGDAGANLPMPRKVRRRSSLVALAADKSFDPSAAIAGALTQARKHDNLNEAV